MGARMDLLSDGQADELQIDRSSFLRPGARLEGDSEDEPQFRFVSMLGCARSVGPWTKNRRPAVAGRASVVEETLYFSCVAPNPIFGR